MTNAPVQTHSRRNARATAPKLEQARVALDRTDAPRTDADAGQVGVKPGDVSMAEARDRGRQPEEKHEITRRSRSERSVDRFALPDNWKKRGWDYQFWVSSVLGQPVEGTTEIWEGGWRPVYWKDVPKPWAPGAKADEQISRGGQLLYLRPMELTMQAKQEEYGAAEQQKRDRIQSALEGRVSGQEGIADIKGVRPVALGLSVEGEVGTHSGQTQTR